MALPRFITNPIGHVAAAAGRSIDYLTPGAGTGRLTNVGRAIKDPNLVLSNPGGIFTRSPAFTPAVRPTTRGATTSASSVSGQPGFTVGEGGTYDADAAAQAAADAERAAKAGALREQIGGRRETAMQLFSLILGDIENLARSRRSELELTFAKEQDALTPQFEEESRNISGSYSARGLTDSDYRRDALIGAGERFQKAIGDLGDERKVKLAQLGSEVTGQEGSVTADRNYLKGVDVNEFGDDLESLVGFRDQLDQRISELTGDRSSLMTDEGLRGRLNKIAPAGGYGARLKGQLDTLKASPVDGIVKDRIAQGLIGNSDMDEEEKRYWLNYYQQNIEAPQAPQPAVA